MQTKVLAWLQKIKWLILGILKPDYFVWSTDEYRDETKFIKSGERDVKRFILKDNELKENLQFNHASILEIGCGSGRMTTTLVKKFKIVYAVDISSSMINQAKKRLKINKNVRFYLTDGLSFPLNDSSIDLAFSYIVFQHIPDKKAIKKTIEGVYRVLKPGGKLKAQFRGCPSMGFGIFRYFKWFYGVDFTPEELIILCQSIGFKVLKIKDGNTKNLWITIQKLI